MIHQDGRAFLSDTDNTYDAIIVNLPEPETFQVNRFYTDRFFELAKTHLKPGGILSFAMQGFENYIAQPQRQKYSSLYNTATEYFKYVTLLPGQKVYFLCRDQAIDTDIPRALSQKGISTCYYCKDCGTTLKCSRCNRNYFLLNAKTLQCPICFKKEKIPDKCPECTCPRGAPWDRSGRARKQDGRRAGIRSREATRCIRPPRHPGIRRRPVRIGP